MSNNIKLKVLFALLRHGQRVEVGTIISVPAAEAADFLDGTKVELLDAADFPEVVAARRAEVAAQMREHGRTMQSQGGPWQPVAGAWH